MFSLTTIIVNALLLGLVIFIFVKEMSESEGKTKETDENTEETLEETKKEEPLLKSETSDIKEQE